LACVMIVTFVNAVDPPVKEVRYDNLQLKGALPYQEAFKIKGSTNVFTGIADAGMLVIRKVRSADNSSVIDPNDSTQYFWWNKSATGQDSEFEFYVDQGLDFNASYSLTFRFYQRTRTSTELNNTVKAKLLPALNELYRINGGGDIEVTKSKLIAVLTDAINETRKNVGLVGRLIIDNGKVKFNPQLLPVTTNIDFYSINLLVSLTHQLRDEENLQITSRQKVTAFTALWNSSLQQSATAYVLPGGGPGSHFSAAEVAEITAYLKTGSDISTVLQNKINALMPQAAVSPLVTSLIDFVGDVKVLDRSTRRIAALNALILPLKQQYETTFELIFDAIYNTLGSGLTIVGKTETVTLANVTSTKFAVVAGAGIASLNLHLGGKHGPVENQPFAYLGLKYYFRAVDKRVPQPYLESYKSFHKWAVVAGYKVSGDIKFQGQTLGDVIGLKPVLGLSVDLTEFISIDFLGMFYKKSALNPFDRNPTLGLSPCLTISADVDLINRLRQLFSSHPYAVTPPKTTITP
jgi:hypothetical protein